MLRILEVDSRENFYSFVTNQCENWTIVCPNPMLADTIRSRFDSVSNRVETVTITSFMNDQFQALNLQESLENKKNKSELLLILASVWSRVDETENLIRFKKAFNLLTELRSFSLSEQVFENVLTHYDDELKKAVLWFHKVMEQLELIDEHKSYNLLSETLRGTDLPVDFEREKNIAFWGFDFFTATQVDMLKSLGLRNNIYIPIYKDVVNSSTIFDWPTWLDTNDKQKIKFDNDSIQAEKSFLCEYYPKGYLAKKLKNTDMRDVSLLLGVKNIEDQYVQEIPWENISYKVPIDLFREYFNLIEEQVLKYIAQSNSNLEDTIEWFKTSSKKIAIENYRKFKCCLLVLKKMNEWRDLSDNNTVINQFVLSNLIEAAKLDSPRVSLTNLGSKESSKVAGLAQIEEFSQDDVVMVISSSYGSPASSQIKFTEQVEKYLSSIGPIRRNEFEILGLKCKIKDFFNLNNVHLFIEEGITEHDSFWSDVLSNISQDTKSDALDFSINNYNLVFETTQSELKSLSASRLQKYIDCPRSYYFSYIEKKNPDILIPSLLTPAELGQIEHKVIEEYVNHNQSFEDEVHTELIRDVLGRFIGLRNISEKNQDRYFIEIKSYTQKTIETLFNLKNTFGGKISFEVSLKSEHQDYMINGSVDCLMKNEQGTLVFDFKRSNSSFKSYKSITEFEKIQLWFYLSRLIEQEKIDLNSELMIGYFDLSDIQNSIFLTNSQKLSNLLQAHSNIKKILLLPELVEYQKEYLMIEKNIVSKISNDKEFLARPVSPNSCMYCGLQNICDKGQGVNK